MGSFAIINSFWTEVWALMQEWGGDEIRRGGVPLGARLEPFAVARCASW